MITIKIVPDYLNRQEYDHQYEDARLTTWGNGWFFHGNLDIDLGYDKGKFLDLPEEYTIKQYYPQKDKFKTHANLNGIFKCKVEGIPYECIAYLYTKDNHGYYYQKGYVCKSTDFEAIEDAKWNLANWLVDDIRTCPSLYFKYSNSPWITSEELASRVKQAIDDNEDEVCEIINNSIYGKD